MRTPILSLPTLALALATLAALYPHDLAAEEEFEVELVSDKSDGLKNPFGLAFDAKGNLYIAEYLGGRLHRMAPGEKPEIIAGNGTDGFAGDGGPASKAIFNGMHNVAAFPDATLFISDTRGNRIRKITPDGTISTIAGTGAKGFSGDGGPAVDAKLADPIAIALNPARDTLLIADLENRRIRAIDLASGRIRTVAGNGKSGVPKDGAIATEAPLTDPRACDVDSKGNLYILERNGNALRVVRPDGTIHTLAGSGKKGAADGPAKSAEMNGPKHICIDASDRVVIADAENHLIRRYDPASDRLDTILSAGPGGSKLNRPHGVWFHDGALYIADSWNDRVLKATPR